MAPTPRYDLTDRLVAALHEAEDLARGLLDYQEQLPEGTVEKLRRLADECDFLAAQPVARMIGFKR